MIRLLELADPVAASMLGDALAQRRIDYRIENAGISALMPGVMHVRVLVCERDYDAAMQLLRELNLLEESAGDGEGE